MTLGVEMTFKSSKVPILGIEWLSGSINVLILFIISGDNRTRSKQYLFKHPNSELLPQETIVTIQI